MPPAAKRNSHVIHMAFLKPILSANNRYGFCGMLDECAKY